jgi:hypothetical protein
MTTGLPISHSPLLMLNYDSQWTKRMFLNNRLRKRHLWRFSNLRIVEVEQFRVLAMA